MCVQCDANFGLSFETQTLYARLSLFRSGVAWNDIGRKGTNLSERLMSERVDKAQMKQPTCLGEHVLRVQYAAARQ